MFHHGGVTGILSARDCQPAHECYLGQRWTYDGKLLSSFAFMMPERERRQYCGEQGFIAQGKGLSLIRASCRIFAMNGYAEKLLFPVTTEYRWGDPAIGDQFIFVQMASTAVSVLPVDIVDRMTGQVVATMPNVTGRLLADGDRLIAWRTEGAELLVDVFKVDADKLRARTKP